MSTTQDSLDEVASSRRERWLFPSHHKLRHLQGVSVRNLIVAPQSRARGKTIDDDDIPNTLQSPSKILAQGESRGLHQSRSFTDLDWHARDSKKSEQVTTPLPRRRRSTLPWSAPNPQARQIKLEDITKTRMADTFFSIHCAGFEFPVYISEVVEKATNPSFRFFDLNMCGPQVSRLDQLTVKLWAKTAAIPHYVLLVELHLHLQSLQYLGKSLDSFHQPLPSNSILFHFVDGVYANLTDMPPVWTQLPSRTFKRALSDGGVQATSSYDALMRLASLDECIQDALATRSRLQVQIAAILESNQRALKSTSAVFQAQNGLSRTKHAVAAAKKQLRGAVKRKEDLIASIKTRQNGMAHCRESQEKALSHLPDAKSKLASSAELLGRNNEDAKGQIRRISEDLQTIYPIEPIPDKPLAFTIVGHALPNSSFGDIDRDAVAAALGYTAHLVYLLSFYLSVPVPYPVSPSLSTSHIRDPISISLPQRIYPLYPVNTNYRFEYGVFLLNKDIEFLLNKQGLRVLDIRHTLPNLKYLLYVLTARTSGMPARKAGGIRGLLPGRLTPNLSRRVSEDSVIYGQPVFPELASDRRSSGVNGDAALVKGEPRVMPSAGERGHDRLANLSRTFEVG